MSVPLRAVLNVNDDASNNLFLNILFADRPLSSVVKRTLSVWMVWGSITWSAQCRRLERFFAAE